MSDVKEKRANAQKMMDESFMELGKLMVSTMDESEIKNDDLVMKFIAAKSAEKIYNEATKEYCEVLNVEICPKCGGDIVEGDLFCAVCGAKILPKLKEDEKLCAKCGKIITIDDMFCAYCGAKQE